MRRRKLPAFLLGVVTITASATLAGAPAAQALPAGAPADKPAPSTTSSVTLITGDRVTVRGDGTTSVEPGPGRRDMRFATYRTATGRHVVPVDALRLLRAGKLDARLFDLTALTAAGYTDERTRELPLLVAYPKAQGGKARSATTVQGARVTRDLSAVGALAVRADRAARASLWEAMTGGTDAARTLQPGIDRIWLDGKRKINLDVSVPQIGAPTAWQAGFDGTGVTVAVLDSGIDATHPDLAGKIVAAENFTDAPDADDNVGHGTHVASTIAGTGAASNGRYKGVAPGAKLLIGKVCGTEFCEESAILAGMAWAAERAPIINISLGGDDLEGIDPLEQAINDLTARYSTLFVVSAGNAGGFAPVGSPASADAALAVGAVDRDDQVADFSSRGPRVGDNAIKPEITAPGVEIVAAKAAHDVIGGPAPVAGYSTLSGTSMAAPHVAGAAAILVQQHPDWSSQQRKTVLMGAAKPTEGFDVFAQGAGRVDVARAIKQSVGVDEGSVSFTGGQWPHGDDTPESKTVTYRNSGTAPVTLTLAVDTTGPAGLFTVSPGTLTVPAGGTATTTLTSDTSVDGPEGLLSGYLTATGADGLKVETPIAVNREPESYDLTFKALGRDGAAAENAYISLFDLKTGTQYQIFGADSAKRLPKAEYGMYSFIDSETESSLVAQPKLAITGPATITVDARDAKPVDVKVPRADAVPTFIVLGADWTIEQGVIGAGIIGLEFDQLFAGQRDPKSSFDGFLSSAVIALAQGDGVNSPYVYDLAYFREQKMLDGLRKNVKAKDLATIKATYATEATGAQGVKANSARYTPDGSYWGVFIPFDPPFRRTEYVNTDNKAQWSSAFEQQLPPVGDGWPETLASATATPATFRGGRTYQQEWNRAVFAPTVAGAEYDWDYVSRLGDLLWVGMPSFGEGPGHPGFSTIDSARTALYRGNTLVTEVDTEWAEVELPAAAADYRLEKSVTRSAPHQFSTQVSGTWTFRSGNVAGETPKQVALSTLRFSPKLDDRNSAPAGRPFVVPVHVDHQAGTGTANKVTVDVSYDDGRTWTKAPVAGSGDHRVAAVWHPRGKGFVSLRASATDQHGGTVTQTVIRAYAIG
ncbi:S8 family serine peptidase [Actinoplanes friuliensis]|uniref:Putative subtilase-family protease n=1 Tax=Actinoplanes friuliensis DSM 7358 TaxID=1246995 RepID=U5VTE9_9ACTN|nr:S8 family serine peptidase [Actinoplanes friuliensis]AGZ40268.1 putative subtilase-family protease [Actinoplanes friuliensis DSM 7358]